MMTNQTKDFGKLSIRKNDMVQVMSGKEKGKTGRVLKVLAKSNRILVEKTNMVKRHVKPSQQNPQGGLIEKESTIHYSNVLLMCPKCNRGVRHGHKMEAGKKGKKGSEKQSKVRVCKRCETVLETSA
jgi:large subunit ribosomal protein L24